MFLYFFSGRKTNPGRRGQPGHPGYMNLLFYKVSTKTWQVVSLEESYGADDFHLKICDTSADLKRGRISIKGSTGEVAENLAVVFSVCLLHVFLQPRPANWEPGQSLVPKQTYMRRGARSVRHINAESVALIMAAGLLIATPSNHFIRKKMKDYSAGVRFGKGGVLHNEENECQEQEEATQSNSEGMFGGGNKEEGTEPHEIFTDLLADGEESQQENDTGNIFGERENNDLDDMVENLTMDDVSGDMYGDLGADMDVYGEDFNTFLGNMDTDAMESGGDNSEGGWGVFGNDDGGDGDAGGCGGCGGGDWGGDIGGGGGDSGGGGIFGGGFSGGAFGDSGGDGGGDIGGAFGGIDFGGGDGGGWGGADSGDGGGGGWGDSGGGGDGGVGGDGGGCGGCGG